jgi:putative N-acetylmannosamine-6-phosphate epimerase
MNQYDDNSLPIIIVITQNYNDDDTEFMTNLIQDEFQILNREINIVPVVAEDHIQKKRNQEIVTEKEGIEDLIKISFQKSQKAIYPAFMKSVKEKIIQAI